MKSSTGQYFQALDHVRALAAFVVFAWHFIHFQQGQLAGPLAFPLSLFTEGHTGVAIFMTLSGYLFARLLDNRKLLFIPFLWNRVLRLAPLLVLVFTLLALQRWWVGALNADFFRTLLEGFVRPVWPNGGWSIAVEMHFYLVLPLLLWLAARSPRYLLWVVAAAVALRLAVWQITGEVQSLAYWTLLGRIDQFVLGIWFFHYRNALVGRGGWVALGVLAFLLFWYGFDAQGGFYVSPAYPSPSPVWVVITLFEGLAYGMFIAWYDGWFRQSDSRWATWVAAIGTYSYSIYLLHFFVVFEMPAFVHTRLFALDNPYVLLLMAIPCFLLLVPLAWASYRWVESPFLRFRRRYIH